MRAAGHIVAIRRLVLGPGDDPLVPEPPPTGQTDALIHRLYLVTWAMWSKW
jgi:hypothetical protein